MLVGLLQSREKIGNDTDTRTLDDTVPKLRRAVQVKDGKSGEREHVDLADFENTDLGVSDEAAINCSSLPAALQVISVSPLPSPPCCCHCHS